MSSSRARCGTCEGCRRNDCGRCRSCRGKKKFGGDGSSHKACELRLCVRFHGNSVGGANHSKNHNPTTTTTTTTTTVGGSIQHFPPPPPPPLIMMMKKKKKRRTISQNSMYGVPSPEPIVNVCAGCGGARNEELEKQHDDAILLCDGDNCENEYHMSCSLPPLSTIPEGSYYCVDCDPLGSTAQLQVYFEHLAEQRATFATSRDFVEWQCRQEDEGVSSSNNNNKDARIPRSELDRMTESHRDALKWNEGAAAGGNLMNDASASANTHSFAERPLGPEFLVGKPLCLYCRTGNQYHYGRILDWRRATHLAPVTAAATTNNNNRQDEALLFHGTTEIARCEFLVKFPAGMDYRKRTLHQWIILEEHPLAVGVSLIWGLLLEEKGGSGGGNNKKGQSLLASGWAPGQTWLRTSLELYPVRGLLSEAQAQISYLDRPKPNGTTDRTWALVKFFGRQQQYKLISLSKESVDFFRESFLTRQCVEAASAAAGSGGTTINASCWLLSSVALARAEAEEQNRIQQWYSMPLKNPKHKRALTIADEAVLPALSIREAPLMGAVQHHVSQGDDDEADETPPLPSKPCQLIPQGLDRQYLMGLLRNRGSVEWSKDTAASLSCSRVVCTSADAMEQLRCNAKRSPS